MALKTFNLNEEIYKQFSKHCKKEGISMSKKVENFIRSELQKIRPFQIKKIKTYRDHPMMRYT
jgi:hypothetical protein